MKRIGCGGRVLGAIMVLSLLSACGGGGGGGSSDSAGSGSGNSASSGASSSSGSVSSSSSSAGSASSSSSADSMSSSSSAGSSVSSSSSSSAGSASSGSSSSTALVLSGRSPWTGFQLNYAGAVPVSSAYSGSRAASSIQNLTQRKVILYMHGQSSSVSLEDCSITGGSGIPSSLTTASGSNLIFYICSAGLDANAAGDYVYERVTEFENVIKEMRAAGVPAANIYLAGHSAGGWSALMTASKLPAGSIGGVIAYAPAFAGTRASVAVSPAWDYALSTQIKDLTSGTPVHALVFAYEDDAYNRPVDLQYLLDAFPQSLTMNSYNCGNGHASPFNFCKESETVSAIQTFISGAN